jgi:hypothetical protein
VSIYTAKAFDISHTCVLNLFTPGTPHVSSQTLSKIPGGEMFYIHGRGGGGIFYDVFCST